MAIRSLALGIGCKSAVFSFINTIFFDTIQGVEPPRQVRVRPAFYRLCYEPRLGGMAPFQVVRTAGNPRALIPAIACGGAEGGST